MFHVCLKRPCVFLTWRCSVQHMGWMDTQPLCEVPWWSCSMHELTRWLSLTTTLVYNNGSSISIQPSVIASALSYITVPHSNHLAIFKFVLFCYFKYDNPSNECMKKQKYFAMHVAKLRYCESAKAEITGATNSTDCHGNIEHIDYSVIFHTLWNRSKWDSFWNLSQLNLKPSDSPEKVPITSNRSTCSITPWQWKKAVIHANVLKHTIHVCV